MLGILIQKSNKNVFHGAGNLSESSKINYNYLRPQPAFHKTVVETEISCTQVSLWQATRKTALPLHQLGEDAEVFIEVQSMSKT